MYKVTYMWFTTRHDSEGWYHNPCSYFKYKIAEFLWVVLFYGGPVQNTLSFPNMAFISWIVDFAAQNDLTKKHDNITC